MKRFMIPAVLVLFVLAGPAGAQTQTRQAPVAAQQPAAPRDLDPNTMANAVLQLLQAFDNDQAGAIWDGASAVTKRSTKREEFVGHLTKTRKPLGAVAGRSWMVVRRQQVAGGGQLPPGMYASIEFATQFQNNRIARELISMRQDEDGMWRFSGYVIE